MDSKEETPELPLFPVITVEVDEENSQIFCSAPGSSLLTITFDKDQWQDSEQVTYRNTLVAQAAHSVAEELSLSQAVRVNVVMDEENTFKMWLPPDGHELKMLPEASLQKAQSPQGKSLGGLSFKLIGAITAFVLMALGMVGAVVYKNNQAAAEPEAAYTPPPVQLPVSAPAGWDTFADYSLEATTAPPLIVGDKLLYASGSELKIVQASDGVEISSHSVSFQITSISTVYGLGDNLIAVGGASNQAAIGSLGSDLHEIAEPVQQAKLHWVSGAPVFTSTGAVWVPSADGSLKKLVAPADTVPAVVFGENIWMVSTVDTQAWLISSDNPTLPEPVKIPAPGGYTYQGFIASVNNHLAFAYSAESKGTEQTIVLADATADGVLENGRSVAGTYNQAQVSVDLARNLLLTGGTLVDVQANQAVNVGSNALYGGGYAWVRGTEPKKVAVDGTTATWATSSSTPIIPSDVDETGRAVVLYKPTSQDVPSKLYVLRKE